MAGHFGSSEFVQPYAPASCMWSGVNGAYRSMAESLMWLARLLHALLGGCITHAESQDVSSCSALAAQPLMSTAWPCHCAMALTVCSTHAVHCSAGAIMVGTRAVSESGAVGSWRREQLELFCISRLINCSVEATEEQVVMDFSFPVGTPHRPPVRC